MKTESTVKYVLRIALTLLAITAVVAVDYARAVKVRPGDAHPHLQRWRAAMALRPSMG